MAEHSLTLCEDAFDGFPWAECACGWTSPPCPGLEEAAGFYADHQTSALLAEHVRQGDTAHGANQP